VTSVLGPDCGFASRRAEEEEVARSLVATLRIVGWSERSEGGQVVQGERDSHFSASQSCHK